MNYDEPSEDDILIEKYDRRRERFISEMYWAMSAFNDMEKNDTEECLGKAFDHIMEGDEPEPAES